MGITVLGGAIYIVYGARISWRYETKVSLRYKLNSRVYWTLIVSRTNDPMKIAIKEVVFNFAELLR